MKKTKANNPTGFETRTGLQAQHQYTDLRQDTNSYGSLYVKVCRRQSVLKVQTLQ